MYIKYINGFLDVVVKNLSTRKNIFIMPVLVVAKIITRDAGYLYFKVVLLFFYSVLYKRTGKNFQNSCETFEKGISSSGWSFCRPNAICF